MSRTTKRTFFNGWFKNWTQNKVIYPPSPSLITTQNRLYPNYITKASELQDLILIKHPLILNFTVSGDPRCNKLTSILFDVLANKDKYPLDTFEVHLANITCDEPEAKDLMLTYGVNKIPSLVKLEKQLPVDSFVPNVDSVSEETIQEWLKTFK